MKKALVLALVATLVAGALVAPATAKKKKGKKPVVSQLDQRYYLRRDGCGSDNDNTRLSTTDGPDVGCWYSDSGILYDVVTELFAAAGEDIDLSEAYPAADGLPLKLDATKPITGELVLYGGDCIDDPLPCSPIGITAGQARFEVKVYATIGGEEKEIGTFTDEFTATPGSTHTTKLSVPIDGALNGATVEAFRITVYRGGTAYGPGGISYDDPASFVSVPTLVTN
jgi:hypothetical protein